MFWSVDILKRFFYVLQRFCRFPLLATAIPHHTFRKLPPRQARKVGSNLRNQANHVIMPVNQSSSFRRFRSANYFPHSAFPQITHTLFNGKTTYRRVKAERTLVFVHSVIV